MTGQPVHYGSGGWCLPAARGCAIGQALCAMQGQHEQALQHLQAAQELAPQHALPKLLLGAAHLGHAMSRKVANRHMTVLTAFAHLEV